MSKYTAAMRLASLRTGLTEAEIETRVEIGDEAFLEEALSGSRIEFLFHSEPSLDDIDKEIDAFVERFDMYPDIIVIDNLLDMAALDGDDLQSNKDLLLEFKAMREHTGAFVLVVHHNKEESDPNYPAQRKSIQNKLSQTPELILACALDQTGPEPIYRVATVKQRSGPTAADGKRGFEMVADPARTNFRWRASNGAFGK